MLRRVDCEEPPPRGPSASAKSRAHRCLLVLVGCAAAAPIDFMTAAPPGLRAAPIDAMRRGSLPARLSLNREGGLAQQPETLPPCASPRDALAADLASLSSRDLPRANTPAVLPGQQINLRARRRSVPLHSLGEADEFAGFEPPTQHQLPPSDRRRPRRNTDEDVLARSSFALEPSFSGASGISSVGDPLSATAGPWRPAVPWEEGGVVVSSRPQPKRTRRGTKELGPLEEAANSALGTELPFPSWRGGGVGVAGSLSVPSLSECHVVSRSCSNSSSTIATGGVGGGSGSNGSSLAASPRVHPSPRRRPSMGGAGGLLDPLSEPVAVTDACAAARHALRPFNPPPRLRQDARAQTCRPLRLPQVQDQHDRAIRAFRCALRTAAATRPRGGASGNLLDHARLPANDKERPLPSSRHSQSLFQTACTSHDIFLSISVIFKQK